MEMKLVGFAGFQEEGKDVYLYQCPNCKKIGYNTGDTLFCHSCRE